MYRSSKTFISFWLFIQHELPLEFITYIYYHWSILSGETTSLIKTIDEYILRINSQLIFSSEKDWGFEESFMNYSENFKGLLFALN